MKLLKTVALFIFLAGLSIQSNGQSMVLANGGAINPMYSPNHKVFSAILVDGKTLVQPDTPDGSLSLGGDNTGILSVATVEREGKGLKPIDPVGFMVAIKNHRTNTVWMLTKKMVYKVDIGLMLLECEWGDSLIIMPVDPKYSLPRNQVSLLDGC